MARPENPINHENISAKKSEASRLRFGIPVPPKPESQIPIISPDMQTFRDPQEFPWVKVRRDIKKTLTDHLGDKAKQLQVDDPPKEINADLAVAFYSLAKSIGKNPSETTKEVADSLQKLPTYISHVESSGGFLNFELDINPFAELVLGDIEKEEDNYGAQNIGEGKTVVFDTSSPNVAKYMSVGHLRSTVIGESLARIYKKTGYTVIRDNHLGDWGTQFGMLGAAVDRWKDEVPELQGADPVQGLYKLYVRMHQEIDAQKEMQQGEVKTETVLEKEGRAWFQRLEAGNPEALKLLKWSTEMSLKEFQTIYDRLGSEFEYVLGESFYVPVMPGLISKMKELGVATKDESTDAVKINFDESEKKQLGDSLVIVKKDGTSLYSTRDLATLVCRTEWFNPDKIIYVVGGDQEYYFRQLFAGFKKFAQEKSPNLEHVSFGRINLPEGKMSTRQGRVIFLKDVLDEAKNRARNMLLDKEEKKREVSSQRTVEGIFVKETEDLAEMIGVGAVIYSDLGQGRERNINFDWNKALSLEGSSAPYMQYTHARAKGILRNAQDKNISIDTTTQPVISEKQEKELIKNLSLFPRAIARAMEKNQPSIISEYLLTTTDLFNKFYADIRVLSEEDKEKRNTRLRLTKAASQVISNGLDLLGIKAPERV